MSVKLKLPPGFYTNGTEYSSAGRWLRGNLIRWQNDNPKPIHGWQKRTDQLTGAPISPLWGDVTERPRSMWYAGDALTGLYLYIGTNKKIYQVSGTNAVVDVTPTGFLPQDTDAISNAGYGLYKYNYGKYGTPRPVQQELPPFVFSWGFSSWGAWPTACARGVNGERLKIKKNTDAKFVDITTAPQGSFDAIVTDERFLMSFGKVTNERLIEWSDREDYTVWTPLATNEAGSESLSGTGKLICGVQALNQILILGENDAFVGRYVGPPYVYGFNRVGNNCGAVGPNAVAVTDTFAAWIGNNSFWIYDGVVQQLPCDVLDYFLRDMNRKQRSKIYAFTVSDYSEAWWLYQSTSSTGDDCDSYIIYNYAKRIWYYGRIARTVGMDNDPLIHVAMVSQDGVIYDHEIPNAGRDGLIPTIQTGPLELETGSELLGFDYVYPDAELQGDVKMRITMRDMPQMPVRNTMEFDLLNPTSTTGVEGRDLRLEFFSAGINPDWVLGDFRVEPIKIRTSRR